MVLNIKKLIIKMLVSTVIIIMISLLYVCISLQYIISFCASYIYIIFCKLQNLSAYNYSGVLRVIVIFIISKKYSSFINKIIFYEYVLV